MLMIQQIGFALGKLHMHKLQMLITQKKNRRTRLLHMITFENQCWEGPISGSCAATVGFILIAYAGKLAICIRYVLYKISSPYFLKL